MLEWAKSAITINRRSFLGAATVGTGVVLLGAPWVARAQAQPHTLPPLPYGDAALVPTISANTIGFHYGKHHQGYLTQLNTLLADLPDLAGLSLEDLIKKTSISPNRMTIFNNAAQVWNHTFYWNSMKPGGGGQPSGKIKDKIDADLGGYDKFREAFKAAATTQFGSGWAWLIVKDGKLAVTKTPNAETPIQRGEKALLTIDVWEHAYYLDFQNRRGDYVDAWMDKLLNWEFVAQNLG